MSTGYEYRIPTHPQTFCYCRLTFHHLAAYGEPQVRRLCITSLPKIQNFSCFCQLFVNFTKKKKSISRKDKWWIHPHWNPLQLTTALNAFWIKKQQQHCIKVAQKPRISLDIFNPQSSKTIQQSPRIRLEAGEKAGEKMSLHYLSKTRWGQYLSKDVKIRVTSE